MLTALLASLTLAVTFPPACSVRELRGSPSYQWSAERIGHFVDSADVIVRAKAVAPDRFPVTFRDSTRFYPGVRFEIVDALRGQAPERLVLFGDTVSTDDYNPLPVPYRMVRRSGQRGDCFASEYRIDREYLLLLRRIQGALTTQWMPLAPVNEQVRGEDDPWVKWVSDRVRNSGPAPLRRPK